MYLKSFRIVSLTAMSLLVVGALQVSGCSKKTEVVRGSAVDAGGPSEPAAPGISKLNAEGEAVPATLIADEDFRNVEISKLDGSKGLGLNLEIAQADVLGETSSRNQGFALMDGAPVRIDDVMASKAELAIDSGKAFLSSFVSDNPVSDLDRYGLETGNIICAVHGSAAGLENGKWRVSGLMEGFYGHLSTVSLNGVSLTGSVRRLAIELASETTLSGETDASTKVSTTWASLNCVKRADQPFQLSEVQRALGKIATVSVVKVPGAAIGPVAPASEAAESEAAVEPAKGGAGGANDSATKEAVSNGGAEVGGSDGNTGAEGDAKKSDQVVEEFRGRSLEGGPTY